MQQGEIRTLEITENLHHGTLKAVVTTWKTRLSYIRDRDSLPFKVVYRSAQLSFTDHCHGKPGQLFQPLEYMESLICI